MFESYHSQEETSGKQALVSSFEKKQKERTMMCDQLERLFESFPDSVLVCDQEGKMVWLNAVALKLFEVASSAHWKGTSREQFLQNYAPCDEQQRPISPEWLMKPIGNDEAGLGSPGKTLLLHLPPGRKVSVDFWCFPVFGSKKQTIGTASVFHVISPRYQKALHLQHVHEAVLTLTHAISHMPEHLDLVTPAEILLLSPPVIFVAQQLVDVIRQVLACRRVSLLAHGSKGQEYYVAGSGLTAKQEQYWQKTQGRFLPTEWVDETVLARLSTHQEAILMGHSLNLPLLFCSEADAQHHLLVPLVLEHQWVGTLAVVKAGQDSGYTPEEVELVKAVAAQTMLVIDGLRWFYGQIEIQSRVLMQHEIERLSHDFLTIASHELLTPLTVILGNIQVAQRRLEVVKRHLSKQVSQKIEHLEQPLASASQSAWLQNRIINDMIDYARLQTKQHRLLMKPCDLDTLLKETLTSQQRAVPEHTIVLSLVPTEQGVPIFADAERIREVINTYLAIALKDSPIESPVTVQMAVADAEATISVHHERPVIPQDMQELLGECFPSTGESAMLPDLRFGLGFALCRALIEAHHGRIGAESDPRHGETFWFTLPLAASAREGKA